MVLAWVFDVGPQGIQRTEPLREESASMQLRLRIAYAAVVVLLMAGLGYLLYERGLGRAMAGERHGSIAVLPFTNLSGDASKDYFSDGMSEELLNLLARVPGLQVASRTSAFAYKGRNVDIRQVGRELGVETVLEGSVRQAGDQVRITAQLIDTETGFHLWSDTYDRKLADIFAGAGRDRAGDRREAAHPARAGGTAARAAHACARPRTSKPMSSTCKGQRDLEEARRGQPETRDRALPVRTRARPGVRACAARRSRPPTS